MLNEVTSYKIFNVKKIHEITCKMIHINISYIEENTHHTRKRSAVFNNESWGIFFSIAKLDSPLQSPPASSECWVLDENEIYISGLVGCDSLKLHALWAFQLLSTVCYCYTAVCYVDQRRFLYNFISFHDNITNITFVECSLHCHCTSFRGTE